MALKIVRTSDDAAQRPLRLWYGGRQADALALLSGPGGSEHAEDAAQLVPVALGADLDHATALGEALASWDDDVAAYRILRAAIESLIDESGRCGKGRWAPYALAVCEIALPTLERRPHEPVLLNYVGVALYGLGEAAPALRVFEAAGALDADLENLRGNVAAARERARRPVAITVAPSQVRRLRAVREAYRRVAAHAHVVPEPVRISLCMIVKDEEEMLPDCLASAQAGVDEIIVVDTGSSDRTVEIAESFGATVLHFAWTGSFSEARNHGLDAATGDYILWLDADERLEAGDAERLQELAAERWREAFWLVETNFTGQEEVGNAATHLALRLWRNRPAYRFRGAIHEQIRITMPTDLSERFRPSSLRIRHYGYLKSRIEDRDKHARNLELLHAELERQPDDPFTHFNIGTEHIGLGDVETGRVHLERSFALLGSLDEAVEVGYFPILATRLVGARRTVGDLEAADALAAELLERFPAFTDLVFERGVIARDQGRPDDARALFERCLAMGDASAGFAGMVGRGTFLALAALSQLAAMQGDRAEAATYLERSLTEHPGFLAAGLDLADLLLAADGAEPEAVQAQLDAFGHEELTWFLFIGTAFYERGHAAIAEGYFRRALAVGAHHPASRIGLVETLLTQRRYAEVEAEAGDLAVGTLPYVAMQRSRAVAGTLAGDDAAVASALAALAAGGGDHGEIAALVAAAAAVAQRPVEPVNIDAAPALFHLLDAFARLEEFDAFERLVPVAEAAVGDPVEATVALGELYLARGFYALAADAALRAMEAGREDARTLSLLGKSAVAEGMIEDALPVLEASLALDPSQGPVRALVEQIHARAA